MIPLVAQARWDSPLGPLTLAATEAGLAGAWFDGQKHHPGPLGLPFDARQRFIAQAIEELQAYFAGAPDGFRVALDLHGTPFQRAVWRALLQIGPGATSTYARLAASVGRPAASRAAGAAVGRNPVSVIVPCHRVLGRDGGLTGYAGGLPRKAWLLRLEGAPMSATQESMTNPQDPAGHDGGAFTTVAAL
ncbi:MAG: methylated-DNA--[protein]-cysteine S-methyltransferase [Pseudomonadota bacterium]